jgi:outer membrane protein TolC
MINTTNFMPSLFFDSSIRLLDRKAKILMGISVYLWLCSHSNLAFAQSANDFQSTYTLPPLDSIIQVCLKNSAVLKLQDAQIEGQYYALKSQKKDWSQRIGANLSSGVSNRVFTQTSEGIVNIQNTYVPFYLAGVSISIPLSQAVDRKNIVGRAQSQYKAALLQKDIQTEELVDKVTTLYYELVTNINILKLRGDALQTLRIQKSLAEKDLKSGNITFSEMAIVTRQITAEESDYETFKQSLLLNWRRLENLIGQPLKDIP